uniref:Uncharacterized protein n=1 Tax=Anguilla anguilla TaxID=7936 RepID=A0A0E9VWT5_ANGAN
MSSTTPLLKNIYDEKIRIPSN